LWHTDNSSNTVLLFLFLWNSPSVYTLVWKHTKFFIPIKGTVKSTIDTSNSSNTVLLYLNCESVPTYVRFDWSIWFIMLQRGTNIMAIHRLFLFLWNSPTCTHYFESIQINNEIYALFKFLPLKKSPSNSQLTPTTIWLVNMIYYASKGYQYYGDSGQDINTKLFWKSVVWKFDIWDSSLVTF
jgi:hypothetical protein